MIRKTLENLMTKTATVGSAKRLTPADRIGLGFRLVATYPADHLSPGQFPLPHNPESESTTGTRQARSVPQMRKQMRAMASAVPPAGPAGCPPVPGTTARRRVFANANRTSFPVSSRLLSRIGRDCQSPDWSDRWLATTEVARATAAGK